MADNLSLDRIGRITGSRIPGILGLSPHTTRAEVMREMVREYFWDEAEFQGNFVTDYGVEHEPDAIAEYELLRRVNVENTLDTQLTVVHDELPIAVTPDGWVPATEKRTEGLLETKCPWRATYTHVDQRPDIYAQMQLQMLTAQREWCDLAVWRYEGTSISTANFDPQWWPSVADEVEAFLAEFTTTIEDEALAEVYRKPIETRRRDDEWVQAEATYWDMVFEVERTQRELQAAKTELQRLAEGKSVKGQRLHLVRVGGGGGGGKGAISYKKALEALVPEKRRGEEVLDRFRGKPSAGSGPSWTYRTIAEEIS